jgi:CheY-like chemotaxis protein
MNSILLVDDDEQFRAMLSEVLADAGYQVHEACNGLQAIKMYTSLPTDLVITDLVMPEKEGLEMITELRQLYADVRIIAVSGGTRGDKQICLKMAKAFGAERVLAKPFSHSEILTAITQVLEQS